MSTKNSENFENEYLDLDPYSDLPSVENDEEMITFEKEVDRIENIIYKYLQDTLFLIVGKTLIEFLTINLYMFIKNEMHKNLLSELENDLNQNEKEFDLDKIESILMNKMLSKPIMNDLLSQTANIYGLEVQKLQKFTLDLAQKRFYKIFLHPEKAKFKLKINNNSILSQSRLSRASLYERLSIISRRKSEHSLKLNKNSGKLR